MKYLLLGVGLLLTLGGALHAQTDAQNLEKYWKLRNDFRDYFVKIGSEAGASIPANALIPGGCIDNINYNATVWGAMHWGDGTFYIGHYLTLLATEYRLLKNSGQDLTGIRNELYYALNAINRLDLNAEQKLGFNYNQDNNLNLNGFMLRDDVPEDFAFDNWGNTNFGMRCTESDMYKNNNAAAVNDPGNGYTVSENSIRNNPSADQVQSILLGLNMVFKLVDDDFVQPTSSDVGFYLVSEVKVITDRMVSFLNEHNWTLIDVNGWPVNNMGGDYIFLAYPTARAGHRITDHNYINPILRRFNSLDFNAVETCMTGYGHDTGLSQNQACENITIAETVVFAATQGQYHAWPHIARVEIEGLDLLTQNDNQDQSAFQSWQAMQGPTIINPLPATFSTLIGQWAPVWDNQIMGMAQEVFADLDDDGKLNNSFGNLPMILFPLNLIKLSKDDGRGYTKTIIFESGVLSGDWTNTTAHNWGTYTGNRELELANYILYDQNPLETSTFYKSLLDGMSTDGPYNLKYKTNGFDAAYGDWLASPNGWGDEYRWGSGNENGGQAAHLGIFSGLDYMVFHNLYYLLYQNNLPPFMETDNCVNNPQPHRDYSDISWFYPYQDQSALNAATDLVNSKTSYIPFKTKNVFQPVNSSVPAATNFTIKPQFDSYVDYKIFTTKHQTQNAVVNPGAILDVNTRFVICVGNTLLLDKSVMNINHSTTIVSRMATINSVGDIFIKNGASLHLKMGSKLILNNLSKLYIEDGGKLIVDEGAIIEYYDGARIYTMGGNSEIELTGQIVIKNTTNFTIIPLGTLAGKLVIKSTGETIIADAPATVTLSGKSMNDPFIFIDNASGFFVQDPDISNVIVNNCITNMKEDSYIYVYQPFSTSNSQYISTVNNNGITLTESSTFNNCIIKNIFIYANLALENTGSLSINSSNLTYDNVNLNCVSNSQVIVSGRSFSIANCNFLGLEGGCINSYYLTQASSITNSTFANNEGTATSYTLIGLVDYSDVEIAVTGSSFNKMNIGIHKQLGKLTLKCSGFSANRENNIYAKNSCDVNLNSTGTAGKNTLLRTLNNKNIRLLTSNITMVNGGNYIELVPNYSIYGSLEQSCTSIPCKGVLNMSGNEFRTGGLLTTPNYGNFQLTYSNGTNTNMIFTPTSTYLACSNGNQQTGKSGGIDSSFVFYSVIRNDSVSALDQLLYAQSRMSIYADSADKINDVLAVNLMHELLTAPELIMADTASSILAWQAYNNMKSALESAFKNGVLAESDNAASFDTYTEKYAQALMQFTAPIVDSSNFEEQYFLELDKAHLFRMLGHKDIAYNMLLELESCGIDSLTQSIVNNWKSVLLEELITDQLGVAAMDTTIIIDTSDFINPLYVVNGYSFGAQIYNVNNIVYPNCNLFGNKIMALYSNNLNVYPNPSANKFYLHWSGETKPNQVLIEQGDGKMMQRFTWPNEESKLQNDCSNWAPGVYLIKVIDQQGKIHSRKLVVQ